LKYHFDKVVEIESKYQLWDIRYKNIPIWHFLREKILSSTQPVFLKQRAPSLLGIIKSCFLLLSLKFRNIDRAYFFVDRKDLLDFYLYNESKNHNTKSAIFVHQEQFNSKSKYTSCDFLNVIRYFSRKLAWRIFFIEYCRLCGLLNNKIVEESDIKIAVKNTIGDYWTIRIIRLFIPKAARTYYSGVGVPGIEKYLNTLSSFEVQHGVIHSIHPGYSNIPKTKNTFIVYAERYFSILSVCHFYGHIIFENFKSSFQNVQSNKKYPLVIYTQPLKELTEFINTNILNLYIGKIFVQIHPRDDFNYDIDDKYIVKNLHPNEVGCAIVFNSSVIEDLALNEIPIVLLNFNFDGIDVAPYFKIFDGLIIDSSKYHKCSSIECIKEKVTDFVT